MKTIVQSWWHVCLWWWYHVMRAPSHCTVQSVASVTTYNNMSHFLVTVHTWSDLTNSKLQPMLKWSVHILLCVNANINLGVCIWVMRGDLIPTVVVTVLVPNMLQAMHQCAVAVASVKVKHWWWIQQHGDNILHLARCAPGLMGTQVHCLSVS